MGNELDMFRVSEELLGSTVAFNYIGKPVKSSKLLNIPRNNIFYGMKDKNTAICYDLVKEEIRNIIF